MSPRTTGYWVSWPARECREVDTPWKAVLVGLVFFSFCEDRGSLAGWLERRGDFDWDWHREDWSITFWLVDGLADRILDERWETGSEYRGGLLIIFSLDTVNTAFN